jgi:hypothetical protein
LDAVSSDQKNNPAYLGWGSLLLTATFLSVVMRVVTEPRFGRTFSEKALIIIDLKYLQSNQSGMVTILRRWFRFEATNDRAA